MTHTTDLLGRCGGFPLVGLLGACVALWVVRVVGVWACGLCLLCVARVWALGLLSLLGMFVVLSCVVSSCLVLVCPVLVYALALVLIVPSVLVVVTSFCLCRRPWLIECVTLIRYRTPSGTRGARVHVLQAVRPRAF